MRKYLFTYYQGNKKTKKKNTKNITKIVSSLIYFSVHQENEFI